MFPPRAPRTLLVLYKPIDRQFKCAVSPAATQERQRQTGPGAGGLDPARSDTRFPHHCPPLVCNSDLDISRIRSVSVIRKQGPQCALFFSI